MGGGKRDAAAIPVTGPAADSRARSGGALGCRQSEPFQNGLLGFL